MDKNIFKIPVSKFISLYRAFNPRVTFLVNLTDKNFDELFQESIKFDEDVILENLEAKTKNFSLHAHVKSNTIFYLKTFNANFEKIINVEEIYNIFLICSKSTDQKIVKKYTQAYPEKTIGIILLI